MADSKQNVNSYSPEGRIYQLEYAMKASNLGTTTVGFVLNNEAVLISEKKVVNKHQLINTLHKHFKVFDHIVFGFSGIVGDAKSVVSKAREHCLSHNRIFNENIPIEALLKHLCKLALKFGEKDLSKKIFSRPFGASILAACYEEEPKLHLFDPSGSYRRFKAKVLGTAANTLEKELVDKFSSFSNLEESIVIVLGMLKDVMRDKISSENVEICVVNKEGIKNYSVEEVGRFVNKI